jgi:hypothetical protein
MLHSLLNNFSTISSCSSGSAADLVVNHRDDIILSYRDAS